LLVGPDGELPLPWLAMPLAETLSRQRAHALLVKGAPGSGVLEFALTLAQAWLCESAQPQAVRRPCGHCEACRLVQSHMHPDLLVLLPEEARRELGWPLSIDKPESAEGERRKASRQIRIDDVRCAIDWITRTNSRGRAKVVVLHPAELLNLQSANALLKTLEEPPAGARLVLTAADPARLMPTVRSRCQQILLAEPPAAQALAWLQGQGVPGAEVLLAATGGQPLRALEMSRTGIDAAAWSSLPQAVRRGQTAGFQGWPLPRSIDALQRLCHDLLCTAAGAAPRFFPAASLPAVTAVEPLLQWQRSLSRVARHDEHPWSEGLLLEALVHEARAAMSPPPDDRGPRRPTFATLAP
jgi:DNA polymerase III subunit delta'